MSLIEIDTLEAFDVWLAAPGPHAPAAIQNLDLTDRTDVLCGLECPGSLFLACVLDPRAAGWLVQHDAVVVPDLPNRSFTAHRASLYAAEDLYDRFDPDDPASYLECLDQRIYQEYLKDGKSRPHDISVNLWQGLHDHSISDALWDLLDGHRVVAIMGGHGMERRDPRYAEVVRLAKHLAEQGYLLASGGGPGAMEATHLGAWLAGRDDDAIEAVLASAFTRRPAGAKPNTEYADPDWLTRAWRVREAWPRVSDVKSVGIPTWLYGHEPPTPFATHIAKYFANSIREDGVLAVATHGVVFAPGSAGTTQEIFQDACQNHYGTMGLISPMILLDRDYWTTERPVWPLLEAVSKDELYGQLVDIVDTADEVVARIQAFESSWYRVPPDPFEAFEVWLRRSLTLRSNWRFDREDAPPSATALGPDDAARLVDWLFAIGDDDWIDRPAALAACSAWLAESDRIALALAASPDDRPLHSSELLVLRDGERAEAWRAVLLD
jgi:predicted Rossmann-fold nucleotide-binding protein